MAHIQTTCEEVRERLYAFLDGELEADAARQLEDGLEGCPECRDELTELRAVVALSREAVHGPAEAVDFSGFYDGVMARIAAEERPPLRVAAPVEKPGLFERFSSWMGELVRFERPMAAFGAALVVAVAVGGLYLASSGGERGAPGSVGPAGPTGPVIAQDGAKGPVGGRRGMETEHSVAGRNQAFVESAEAAQGRVVVEAGDDQGDQPVVVWHLTEEGEPAPAPDAGGPEQGL